jgi:plastocyanin
LAVNKINVKLKINRESADIHIGVQEEAELTIRAALLCAVLAFGGASLCPLRAADIDGSIIVKKKLTKRRVTASLPLYQRGPAVELTPDAPEDPLSFERSRVVVYLEGRRPAPPVTAIVDQENRRFGQDTVVIPAGSRVSFPNQDPIFHNVFSLSRAKAFDLGSYPKGETRMVTFNEPGVVYVNCHLHANMAATIVVTPNQWYAKADKDGHFTIRDVPPGTWTVVAWHKAAGFFRKQIEVTAGGGASLDFLIPLDDATPAVHEPVHEGDSLKLQSRN